MSFPLPKLALPALSVSKLTATLPFASPCAANEAVNITSSANTLGLLFDKVAGTAPALQCKACPEGAVAKAGSYACTIWCARAHTPRRRAAPYACARLPHPPARSPRHLALTPTPPPAPPARSPPGTFADRALGECRRCALGNFSGAFGARFCSPCAAGSFAPYKGAFACVKCPPGFKAPNQGAFKCDYVGFASAAAAAAAGTAA